jgi:hypothetical protein
VTISARLSAWLLPALAAVALLASGCGDGQSGADAAVAVKRCPSAIRPGWVALAKRVGVAVYCPAWMPSPLRGKIDPSAVPGADNATVSISSDGSYLTSWIWAEAQTGEVHVILRGYPGRTTIPSCVVTGSGTSANARHRVPCFADPHGTVRVGEITATLYTVNQGADQWHLLYAWRHRGTLYTVSQHVAAPLSYSVVKSDLRRMLTNLVLVEPSS